MQNVYTSTAQSTSPLSKQVSISFQNQKIPAVLKEIERLADVRFTYNTIILQSKPSRSFSFKNTSIKSILKTLIDDSDLVFYEFDKYIIISRRRDIPQGTLFQRAIQDEKTGIAHEKTAINDTLIIHDTITYIDTVKFLHYDTLVVNDTVKYKKEKAESIKANKTNKNKSNLLSLEVFPSYHYTANNKNDVAKLSFGSQFLYSKNFKNVGLGVGLGFFMQNGASVYFKQTTSLDSTEHNEERIETIIRESAHYYFKDSLGITQLIILYDTINFTYPVKWYTYNKTTETIEEDSKYSITWITLPLRFCYKTQSRKKVDFSLVVTLSPALRISSGGAYYSTKESAFIQTESKSASFSLFLGLSPTIIFKLNKIANFYVSPCIQTSLTPSFSNENYYSLSAGIALGVSISLSK
ncbi:MAG: hypothetical protein IPO21_11015 [Bacteroidales bacterium]|nr:hypothetical protein [Bacteroidales bacterium]